MSTNYLLYIQIIKRFGFVPIFGTYEMSFGAYKMNYIKRQDVYS